MAKDYDELVEQYGDGPSIPHADLYQFLIDNRENLANEQMLGVDRIPNSPLGQEVCRRCKEDLMWLARWFTWDTSSVSNGGTIPISENLIDEEYYRVVIDLFAKKDPAKKIPEQSRYKRRILLWPRGGMKSTIDHLDTVQWLLVAPDIRILYLTAERTLAEGFIDEVKAHFVLRDGLPTLMSLFFFDWCLPEKDMGAKNTFTCPVWAKKGTKRKEASVTASSVGKHKAGRHYELIKADDAVSDVNSQNSEICETISNKLYLAEKLLVLARSETGGVYMDYIGTRYHISDHYGKEVERSLSHPDIVKTSGTNWDLYTNDTTGVKILIGQALRIKPEVVERLEKEGKRPTYQEAGADGCTYLLPHLMNYSWCLDDYTKNEESFEGQRNQNPQTTSQVAFTRMMLLRATIPFTEMPHQGPVSQFWDMAFGNTKGRDYCVGTSVMWGEDKLTQNSQAYVQEVAREKYNVATTVKMMVALAVKFRPFVIGIEKAGGSQLMHESLILEAIKTKDPYIVNLFQRIDWVVPDNQKGAKKIRIAGIYPWMTQGRFKFANHCMVTPNAENKIEVLYKEFENCMSSHNHEDIPDCLAYQLKYAPQAYQAIVQHNEEMFSRDPAWAILFEEGDQHGRWGLGMPPSLDFTVNDDIREENEPVENYWNFA